MGCRDVPGGERGRAGKQFSAARKESLEWWLMATVCSSLSLQVGKIKVGESQLLFLSLGLDAVWPDSQ